MLVNEVHPQGSFSLGCNPIKTHLSLNSKHEFSEFAHFIKNPTDVAGDWTSLSCPKHHVARDEEFSFVSFSFRSTNRLVGWMAGKKDGASFRIWEIHGRTG